MSAVDPVITLCLRMGLKQKFPQNRVYYINVLLGIFDGEDLEPDTPDEKRTYSPIILLGKVYVFLNFLALSHYLEGNTGAIIHSTMLFSSSLIITIG